MKYYLSVATFISGVILSTSSLNAATLTNFVEQNGKTYAVTDVGLSWTEAEAFAVSQGGHLVTINDATENEFIFDTFVSADNLDYWIGFNCIGCVDYLDPAQWGWSSGEPVTFENFRVDQPDFGSGSDQFGVINFNGLGSVWDNYPDSSFRTPRAIVELNNTQNVPEPSAILGILTVFLLGINTKRKMSASGGK